MYIPVVPDTSRYAIRRLTIFFMNTGTDGTGLLRVVKLRCKQFRLNGLTFEYLMFWAAQNSRFFNASLNDSASMA